MKVSTVKITDFVTGEENKQLVKFISRVFYKKARPRYLLADIKRMTGDNQAEFKLGHFRQHPFGEMGGRNNRTNRNL